MGHIKMVLAAAVSTFAFGSVPASAALIFDSSILVSGQGFGNNPRLLTIQGSGTESGCVGIGGSGSTLLGGIGACIADALVHDGNGVTNAGGQEVNPLSDNQKFGIPTISELGWKQASDIGLVFNATEPGGNAINVQDVTLKFYNGTTLLGAIDGSQAFANTEPGNGVAGFTFKVDAAEQNFLNNLIFAQPGFGNYRIALESTLSDASGGPESWLAVNLGNAVPEPATWGMMILGVGMTGGVMRLRKRKTVRCAST